ncbi:uncharacterized protein LOC132395066 [Hypanus sabinus]|uniref:uncharacterized protein LOC132395066 n=1 Tax=Hypanus sabinus TaxID=79690 RepID=UPI0028C3F123|nr:uncharacterized protein LOC132395066 [Hypanus sabinus]
MQSLPEAHVTSHLGCTENVVNLNFSKLQPRRVVEAYVRRSLSLREGGANNKIVKWSSLPGNVSPKNIKCKEGAVPWKHCRGQEKMQNETVSRKHKDKVMPSSTSSSNVESNEEKQPSKCRSKDGRKGKKSQTFFGKFVSFLWKWKSDEKKGEGRKRLKDPGPSQAENPSVHNGQQHLVRTQEPPGELPIIHKLKKRNSLRRVLSLKRNNSEAKDMGLAALGASKSKGARPSLLDLNSGCRPKENISERDSAYLYEQVSEEVERIVQMPESGEGCEDKERSVTAAEETQCLKSADDNIWKIIEILQNVGDHVDSKLQGDSQLSTFFTNLSYDAFKELADQYVKKEVKNKGLQENPEFVKLAFTLDFTAKVAGVCDLQIKRITGFGSQYLQDTCWQMLSSSEQDEPTNSAERPPSPD